MRHVVSGFAGGKGEQLYCQSWLPDDEPCAALIIVHGFGEHSGRYRHVIGPAMAAGFALHGYDQRGHGHSPGQRGHIDSMSDYRGDLNAFVDNGSQRHPGLPVVVWGHSMGSLVVLDFAIRRPQGLRGVITSGVGLEPAGVATPFIIATARLSSFIWPTLSMQVPVVVANLSRDPQEISDYESDELVHNRGSARWAVSLLNSIKWIKQHAEDVQFPILMLHGDADAVNLPAGSGKFIADVTFPDKQLNLYAGGLHVLHGDLDKDAVIDDMIAWIGAHS